MRTIERVYTDKDPQVATFRTYRPVDQFGHTPREVDGRAKQSHKPVLSKYTVNDVQEEENPSRQSRCDFISHQMRIIDHIVRRSAQSLE